LNIKHLDDLKNYFQTLPDNNDYLSKNDLKKFIKKSKVTAFGFCSILI